MQGLITKERKNIDPAAAPFAKDLKDVEGLREGASLIEVVKLPGQLWMAFMNARLTSLIYVK